MKNLKLMAYASLSQTVQTSPVCSSSTEGSPLIQVYNQRKQCQQSHRESKIGKKGLVFIHGLLNIAEYT